MSDIAQISTTTLPLAKAIAAVEAGIAYGAALGLPFTISVVDAGGFLVAVQRMDGAALAAIETSASKAVTSVLFGQPTTDLAAAVQPGAPLFSIESSTRSPLAFVPGGLPIVNEHGTVIGAIGVGGGAPDQAHDVADTTPSRMVAPSERPS